MIEITDTQMPKRGFIVLHLVCMYFVHNFIFFVTKTMLKIQLARMKLPP